MTNKENEEENKLIFFIEEDIVNIYGEKARYFKDDDRKRAICIQHDLLENTKQLVLGIKDHIKIYEKILNHYSFYDLERLIVFIFSSLHSLERDCKEIATNYHIATDYVEDDYNTHWEKYDEFWKDDKFKEARLTLLSKAEFKYGYKDKTKLEKRWKQIQRKKSKLKK